MAFKTAAELFGDDTITWGTKVPIDTGAPAGTYDSTNRGIGFGEPLTSAVGNRSHYALALNDEDINTRLALWEVEGLNAAYDLGAAAVPGGGREITKDGGAVETTSALAAQYADDIANAHFRANALGDSTPGGGFDFRGNLASAYGLLSRKNGAIAGAYTSLTASVAATLNPGGAGGAVVRFTVGTVSAGGFTDIGFEALDFVEITGAGSFDGLYWVFSLGAAPATDLEVRRLDGTTPAFTASTAATARVFRAGLLSSPGMSLVSGSTGAAISAGLSEDVALGLFADIETSTGGGSDALRFMYKNRSGGYGLATYVTAMGQLYSGAGASLFGTEARAMERVHGGTAVVTVDKGEETGGYHEVGVLVTDLTGDVNSLAPLESRGRAVQSSLGIGTSLPGTYTAPMGTIDLTDTGPTPPGDLYKKYWALGVQPGMTIVNIMSGTGAGRHYLLSAVNLPLAGDDQAVLTHLDGSALDPGELPVAGAMTLRFVQRQVFGGALPPITLNGSPAGFDHFATTPTDFTTSSFLGMPNDTAGDSTGRIAAAVRGDLYGVIPLYSADFVAPGTYTGVTAKATWVLRYADGSFYSAGNITADQSMHCDDLTMLGASAIPCASVDTTINQHLLTGLPEDGATGLAQWRWDQANGVWVSLVSGAILYFPVTWSGRFMTTDIQVFHANTGSHNIKASLQVVTPDWGNPSNAPAYANGNETTSTAANSWHEINISHGVGSGTLVTLGSKSYAIRVECGAVGDKVQALRHSIRFTQIGPGGIGG